MDKEKDKEKVVVEKEPEIEIFQQITNFFDSISMSFSNSLGGGSTSNSNTNSNTTTTTTTQQSNNQQPILQKQSSFKQQQQLNNNNINGGGGGITSTTMMMNDQSNTNILSPTMTKHQQIKNQYQNSVSPRQSQNQFPAFYQYPQKTLKELDDKRLLLIEHLKSVKFNLDCQTSGATGNEEDPISMYKVRMELAKRKTALESELKQLDDILGTRSYTDDPIDGFTSFLNMIIPDDYTSGSSSSLNTSTFMSPGAGLGGHQLQYQQGTSGGSTGSNGSNNGQPIMAPAHHPPNSIVPNSTPLDNADPNQPRFPPRDNINVKLYVDCDDYFAASAMAIENATREVFITAWFLSPEVYLIRYPILDIKYRLDNLLCRKAKQGVKIFIILWDETKIATFKGSKRAKDKLEELHHNIKVIRHPPFTPIYWSHHQKTLIIDQEIAFVGGVDFAFGRFDTWCHHLIDVNSTLWPGKDYYNPCLGEMGDILSPYDDSIDRKKIPRMPWHDVMVGVNGLAARDVALNFVLRWNHHRDDYYPLLYFNTTPLLSNGSSTCQLLRSMDEWSGGGRNERSIHTAYIQAIEDADHYIYIENQNFVSTHAPGVWNQISHEIVKRIRRAIRKHEQFRVMIVLPSQQDGKFQEETHIRGLMHWQYLTLIRDEHSIVKTLKREFPHEDLSEYIGFYSLRTHACLEGSFVTEQIYVHSKLMIVDDRVIIVGSANINDRSLNGERDSELAFIVKDDKDMIKTRMNGKEFMASRVAYNLRLRLWKEHIGLLPHIDHPPLNNQPPLKSNSNINNNNSHHHRSSSSSSSLSQPSILIPQSLNLEKQQDKDKDKQEKDIITLNSNSNSTTVDITSPLTINSQYRIPKQSHHRSSSYQGPKSPLSSVPNSPLESPQDSPRGVTTTTSSTTTQQATTTTTTTTFTTDPINIISTSSSAPPPSSLLLSSPLQQQQTSNMNTNNINNINNINNNNINYSSSPLGNDNIIIEDYKERDRDVLLSSTPSSTSSSGSSIGIGVGGNIGSMPSSTLSRSESILKDLNSNKVLVVSEMDSPKLQATSISSLHYEGVEESVIGGIDLTDPVDSSFYIGVWIATAASNTRIYDTVFAAIPKNSIKTCDEFNQCLKKPVSIDDTRLLSEVRGNLIYHPLEFLANDDIQPTFLFTDDLFQ